MLSRMTPRFLIWGEGDISMVRENALVLDEVDSVPLKRSLVLLLFNLRWFKMNQTFSSEIQSVGGQESG